MGVLFMLAKSYFGTKMGFVPKLFLESYISYEITVLICREPAMSISPYFCIVYGDVGYFLFPTFYILSVTPKPPGVG